MAKTEGNVATKFGKKQRGGLASDVPERRPARLHHVVARDSDEGLELLRVLLEDKGEVLPVFSAGWAAREYLFAEAPGGGWHVRACTPGELVWRCAGVEWVMLDPQPGLYTGGAANLMPRENFVDYLLAFSGEAFPPARAQPASGGTSKEHGERDGRPVTPHDRANGNVYTEVATMSSKLFGDGDRLSHEKVALRRLQSEKQSIHPKDLPPTSAER